MNIPVPAKCLILCCRVGARRAGVPPRTWLGGGWLTRWEARGCTHVARTMHGGLVRLEIPHHRHERVDIQQSSAFLPLGPDVGTGDGACITSHQRYQAVGRVAAPVSFYGVPRSTVRDTQNSSDIHGNGPDHLSRSMGGRGKYPARSIIELVLLHTGSFPDFVFGFSVCRSRFFWRRPVSQNLGSGHD
jgi:hypothetical protein